MGAKKGLSTWVALLRGINVGGKNKLPMADLKKLVELCGGMDVHTYIQSGNVVFRADAARAAGFADALQKHIASTTSMSVPVVMRAAADIDSVLNANPFLAQGAAPDTLHVAFLASTPTAAQLKKLDPARSPGDAFIVKGADVYLHLPNGVARTKLTNAWLDSQLTTTSTMRNWRTVQALADLARDPG